MLIDVFTYTQASPNGPFTIHSLIEAAKCARLDGIAVTDRGSSHRIREYMDIAESEDFLVLYGLELETATGRVVAYPRVLDDAFLNEDWRCLGETPAIEDVLDYFHSKGGIVIARDVFNRGEGLRDSVYSARDSEGRGVDGIDTVAVYRRRIDNELSIEAQQVLGVPACAGSGVFDSLEDIGHCATLFANEIFDQASFVDAMKNPLHWACALRDLGASCPMGTPPRVDEPEHDRHGERRSPRGERSSERGERRSDRREASGDGRRRNDGRRSEGRGDGRRRSDGDDRRRGSGDDHRRGSSRQGRGGGRRRS